MMHLHACYRDTSFGRDMIFRELAIFTTYVTTTDLRPIKSKKDSIGHMLFLSNGLYHQGNIVTLSTNCQSAFLDLIHRAHPLFETEYDNVNKSVRYRTN